MNISLMHNKRQWGCSLITFFGGRYTCTHSVAIFNYRTTEAMLQFIVDGEDKQKQRP